MGDDIPFNNEAGIMNFKTDENTYVRDYIYQGAIELYSPPISDGNITFEVNQETDIVVSEDEFFVAITSSQYEKSGIDIPLCVTKIT